MTNATFEIENEIDYVEEETAKLKRLEKEVADAIVENRDIEYRLMSTTKYIICLKQSKKLRRKKNKKIVTFCRLQLNTIKRTLRLQDIWKKRKRKTLSLMP